MTASVKPAALLASLFRVWKRTGPHATPCGIAQRDVEHHVDLDALSPQAVVDGLQRPDVMALPSHLRREMLFDWAAIAQYLGSMLVPDAEGNIVIDAGSDTRERQFCRPALLYRAPRSSGCSPISVIRTPRACGAGLRALR